MRYKNKLGYVFLTLSVLSLLISANPTISGGLIGTNTGISPIFIVGLAFFILSLLIFASRQTLEAIIIPTGDLKADRERAETAEKHKADLKKEGYFVISGHYPHGNMEQIRGSQVYGIYKHLREDGIIPREMMVEGQSNDTLENTLYSLKKIKQRAEKEGKTGTLDVGISTYHSHFKRFKDFYDRAVQKGMLKKGDFRLHEIPTSETNEERDYESNLLRRISHGFKLISIGRYRAKRGGIKQAKTNPITRITHAIRDALK